MNMIKCPLIFLLILGHQPSVIFPNSAIAQEAFWTQDLIYAILLAMLAAFCPSSSLFLSSSSSSSIHGSSSTPKTPATLLLVFLFLHLHMPDPTHPSLRPQLMKLTQKKCSNKLPKTKSAKARSCEMLSNSDMFSGFVWMRSEAVRTNWPTVALKPERKALKGCLRKT
jgi:hypothetical protein